MKPEGITLDDLRPLANQQPHSAKLVSQLVAGEVLLAVYHIGDTLTVRHLAGRHDLRKAAGEAGGTGKITFYGGQLFPGIERPADAHPRQGRKSAEAPNTVVTDIHDPAYGLAPLKDQTAEFRKLRMQLRGGEILMAVFTVRGARTSMTIIDEHSLKQAIGRAGGKERLTFYAAPPEAPPVASWKRGRKGRR